MRKPLRSLRFSSLRVRSLSGMDKLILPIEAAARRTNSRGSPRRYSAASGARVSIFGYLRYTETQSNRIFVTVECLYGCKQAIADGIKRIVKP